MRSLVVAIVSFSMVAPAAFSQKAVVLRRSDDVSQKDEQQIQQLEAELLKGEMNSDPSVFEKILADDCLNLPAGPDFTKTKLVEGVRKSRGQAPPYIAQVEHMHVYILGETAVAMYQKEYAQRANPGQLDRQDITDVFIRSAGSWRLKISRASQLR